MLRHAKAVRVVARSAQETTHAKAPGIVADRPGDRAVSAGAGPRCPTRTAPTAPIVADGHIPR